MKHLLLFSLSGFLSISAIAQPVAYTGCPGNNVAIERDGFNADDANPVYLYNVNTLTGTASNKTGPILNPVGGGNLQVNGIGLNTTDGFLYGIQPGQVSNPLQAITPRPFYRIGSNAVAEQHGILTLPTLSGGENIAAINAAAGEIDLSDNYYFSAISGTLGFTSAIAKSLWIGKVSGVSAIAAGTANVTPTYTKVSAGTNTSQYYNSLLVTVSAANATDISNNGLRDLVYNPNDNLVYSFVTFPDAVNPGSYLGQMIVVNPATGVMSSPTLPYTVLYASSSVEVAGTLMDKNGNFLVLFTNGAIYKANGNGATGFSGMLTQVSGTGNVANPISGLEGLSGSLRGDMASCGAIVSGGPLPITLNYFNAFAQNNDVTIKWETASEINSSKFILERSVDAVNWNTVYTVNAAGNSGTAIQYSYVDANVPAKTVFYRLQTVNIGGSKAYSNIKKITLDSKVATITYYPNPVRNIVYIESSVAISNTYSVRLNDITGRSYTVPFTKADVNKIKVDISALSAGTYFLQIETDGNKGVQKIIKQ